MQHGKYHDLPRTYASDQVLASVFRRPTQVSASFIADVPDGMPCKRLQH